jgi:hypothetical protein
MATAESTTTSRQRRSTDMSTIESVHAREILDSPGTPTVEVDVRLSDGSFAGRQACRSEALGQSIPIQV